MTMISTTAQSAGRPFGKTPDGQTVDLYTLNDGKGVEATISTYGGVVVSLKTPDRNGQAADVVLDSMISRAT